MKEKFRRFMMGRYGLDSFGKCILIIAIIFSLLSPILDMGILNFIAWVLLFYTYFRIFSRNVYKRYAENQAYLAKTYKIRTWFMKQKNLMNQKKDTSHL